jgi:KipI family sensor histidine kinase inhibitor
MTVEEKKFPRITPVGDSALLIELDQKITPEINAQVHALDLQMQGELLNSVLELVPGYSSILVRYDPLVSKFSEIEGWVWECLASSSGEMVQSSGEIVIPVQYGREDGPDLDFVAKYHHLTPEEVVCRHTDQIYRVGMMGFTPGFAYLMGLDPTIATPRLDTPRTKVPAGSVGIVGPQTGVYPLESPGGWQIIGRTDKKLFDPENAPYFLFSPGDAVRFIPLNDGNNP